MHLTKNGLNKLFWEHNIGYYIKKVYHDVINNNIYYIKYNEITYSIRVIDNVCFRTYKKYNIIKFKYKCKQLIYIIQKFYNPNIQLHKSRLFYSNYLLTIQKKQMKNVLYFVADKLSCILDRDSIKNIFKKIYN